MNDAAALLEICGLHRPQGVDYTAGVFSMEEGAGGRGRLTACGSLKGDMIQGVAVDPAFQGEDLLAKVVTGLIAEGRRRGHRSLYLFTKAEKARQFEGLGFRLAAKARPYAALLEWGEESISQYTEKLKEYRGAAAGGSEDADQTDCAAGGGRGSAADSAAGLTGCLVMNCNPFTRGHRYLCETAAKKCRRVFLLVVVEDVSLFPFSDRLAMVQAGTCGLDNVTVIPGGRYAVSSLTFPSYFTKEEDLAAAHAAIDAEIFASRIGPALGVDIRFVGTEPLSQVTEIYNQTLKKRLPRSGIRVEEISRLSSEGVPVSATRVRAILQDLQREMGDRLPENFDLCDFEPLSALLPPSSLKWIGKPEVWKTMAERMKAGSCL